MNDSTGVNIYANPKDVSKSVAKKIKKLILKSNHERFNIALSGGTTPRKLFKRLAKKYAGKIPWERVHFWWVDERCVDPSDDQSNFKMTHEALLRKIQIPQNNIHRMQGESNPEAEAERYYKELRDNLPMKNGIPVFDLILLGMGDDGHTASIFPGQLYLIEATEWSAVSSHPGTGQKRITLTGKVINNARQIFFMVTGTGKAGRISEIMNNEPVARQYPASYIEPLHGSLAWFIDEEAASELS